MHYIFLINVIFPLIFRTDSKSYIRRWDICLWAATSPLCSHVLISIFTSTCILQCTYTFFISKALHSLHVLVYYRLTERCKHLNSRCFRIFCMMPLSVMIEGPCIDKLSNCAAYGESVCSSYRHWAIENCARFCLFCHGKNFILTHIADEW